MAKTASIVWFPGGTQSSLAESGGKGLSLIRATAAGLPVPPGFILTTDFFAGWLAEIKKAPAWQRFLGSLATPGAVENAAMKQLETACQALKDVAVKLHFSKDQKADIEAALEKMSAGQQSAVRLFAVRSSSPNEDLEGSSFAGGYETILGVRAASIEDAVRRAFASCLDYRVVVYKQQNGFDVTEPRIAMVVQQQIASEIAGVGFSLNPLNNSYDQAVFNANWGLGETVVAGTATPDTFVVDKVEGKILERSAGAKQVSIWLTAGGGTEEKANDTSNRLSLTDKQVLELAKLVDTVEKLYERPIDIEWAFMADRLYLLQARPITTFVPLPDELVTAPGRKKRLYMDATISVQGILEPLSVMGSSFLKMFVQLVMRNVFHRTIADDDIDGAVALVIGGKLYVNLSSVLAIESKDKVAAALANMDPIASRAVSELDASVYKSDNPEVRLFPLGALWELPEMAMHVLEARLLPEQIHRRSQQQFKKFLAEIETIPEPKNAPADYATQLVERTFDLVFRHSIPLTVTSRLALQQLKAIVKNYDQAELRKLELALPNNPTTEMGLALDRVARLLPDDMTSQALSRGIREGSLPQPLKNEVDELIRQYGHRGPMEIDVGAWRYRDKPEMLADLLVSLHATVATGSAEDKFEHNQLERERAYQKLAATVHEQGWLQSQRLQSLYRVFETLGGYREAHKYYMVKVIDLLRQRVMSHGQELAAAGRLDNAYQVFDLSLEQLQRCLRDPAVDAAMLARENRIFPDKLRRLPLLPTLIDSRGMILRPRPAAAKEGEVAGTPISSGVVRGRVKVLASPTEKPLLKGEILVARATDPGWTPLFVNAAGVILEIGGMLQHGALVAREYGLPCVSGIDGATEIWADGTMVEVDGNDGIVRIVE